MDITLAGIRVNNVSVSSLSGVLGSGGFVSLYPSTNRIANIDPFEALVGTATSVSSLEMSINGNSITELGQPTFLPTFSPPSNAVSSLSVGDHMVALTQATVQTFQVGDQAVAASAPVFGIYVQNESDSTVVLDFTYRLTQTGSFMGGLALGSDWGFTGYVSAGAQRHNGIQFGIPTVLSGGLQQTISTSQTFSNEFTGTLSVFYAPQSATLGGFSSNYHISVRDGPPPVIISPVPEPEIYGLLLAGLTLLGFRRRRRAAA